MALLLVALGALFNASARGAQPGQMRGDGPAPEPRPASISRLDPRLDALLAPDAKVELVASGFGLNEGTTWVRDAQGSGFLLLGGLLDNVLYKIPPTTPSRFSWRRRAIPVTTLTLWAPRRGPGDPMCC
jgi:hypothetical protein